jgi:hypothetical protein
MRRRIRRVALAVTAVAVVAIAGGVTYAVADIGGGGEPIATKPPVPPAQPARSARLAYRARRAKPVPSLTGLIKWWRLPGGQSAPRVDDAEILSAAAAGFTARPAPHLNSSTRLLRSSSTVGRSTSGL